MPRPLNPRQLLFVEHYLIDLNGTAAAARAGFASGDSVSLLRRVDVKAAIAAAMAARAARTGITAARVMEEYAAIAFADPRRFADWGPGGVQLRDTAALSPDDTRLIAEIADAPTAHGGTHRVKLFDKLAALRSLLRIVDHAGSARFSPVTASEIAAPALPTDRAAGPVSNQALGQLSDRRRCFADEYLKDFNAQAAARRAGYSAMTARGKMTGIRRDPRVAALIAAGLEEQRAPIRAEADRVLLEYARIAFADIGRIAAWNAQGLRLTPREQSGCDDTAAIEDIGAARGGRMRVRLYDKVYALDALATHLGLLDPRMPGRPEWLSQRQRRTNVALRARLGISRA